METIFGLSADVIREALASGKVVVDKGYFNSEPVIADSLPSWLDGGEPTKIAGLYTDPERLAELADPMGWGEFWQNAHFVYARVPSNNFPMHKQGTCSQKQFALLPLPVSDETVVRLAFELMAD